MEGKVRRRPSPVGRHGHCQAARHCLTEGNVSFGECLPCLREKEKPLTNPSQEDSVAPPAPPRTEIAVAAD